MCLFNSQKYKENRSYKMRFDMTLYQQFGEYLHQTLFLIFPVYLQAYLYFKS